MVSGYRILNQNIPPDCTEQRKTSPTQMPPGFSLATGPALAKVISPRKHSVPVRRADSADQAMPRHYFEGGHVKTALAMILAISATGSIPANILHIPEASNRINEKSFTVSICSSAVESARRRCAASCGGAGYSFSSGACGVGARCVCGTAGGGPGHPGTYPQEP